MIWLLLTACWSWEAKEEVRAIETLEAMDGHYEQGVQAREAIVDGDVDKARKELVRLAGRLPVATLPDGARPHEAALALALERAGEVQDLSAASKAMGDVVMACAACHQAQQIDPFLVGEARPGEGNSGVEHHVAAERVWEALVSGTGAGYDRARATLVEPPRFGGSEGGPPLAASFQTHATRAVAKDTGARDRGTAYGQLLQTCAACHAEGAKTGSK